jgi:acyl carrier protein
MNKEELQRTVSTVVERAIGEQVDLGRLGLTRIEPGTSLIDDLGLDSVDLFTVVYDIEVALNKKLPISGWLAKYGGAGGTAAFTMEALVHHIVEFMQQPSTEETA